MPVLKRIAIVQDRQADEDAEIDQRQERDVRHRKIAGEPVARLQGFVDEAHRSIRNLSVAFAKIFILMRHKARSYRMRVHPDVPDRHAKPELDPADPHFDFCGIGRTHTE